MPFIAENIINSVVIVGSGGFGLEIYDYLLNEAASEGFSISGFLDDAPDAKAPKGIDLPCFGSISAYRAVPGEVVIVAIGKPASRKSVNEALWAAGVETPAYYHSSAVISPAANIGRSTIVCPYSILNRNATLCDGAVLNVHCSVGHGAIVGAFSVLSPYAALNGDASIGELCFLGTRATIYPRINIGNECVVDTHTGVRINATDKQMISSRGNYRMSSIRL